MRTLLFELGHKDWFYLHRILGPNDPSRPSEGRLPQPRLAGLAGTDELSGVDFSTLMDHDHVTEEVVKFLHAKQH